MLLCRCSKTLISRSFSFSPRWILLKNARQCKYSNTGSSNLSTDILSLRKSSTLLRVSRVPLSWKQTSCFNHNVAKKTENFILPDIGEGINEVTIKEWKVKIGDQVKEFDGICDVESDKATATISSRYDGIVTRIYYEVGDMAKVGKPLVDIQTDQAVSDEPKKESSAQPMSEAEDNQSNKPPPLPEPIITALPSVRRLAKEKGIDLSKIKATSKQGHILKEDVLAYLNENQLSGRAGGEQRKVDNVNEESFDRSIDTMVPFTGIQRAMFKSMTQSLKIPHFSYSDEIDMSSLIIATKRRDKLELNHKKVANFAIIIKMVSLALKEFPQLNASIDENGEHLVYKNYHNIGIAVDTKSGLVVPNIKNVQNLSIREINLEMLRLRELGYTSKLGLSDISQGTITLSNIGAIGGVFGVPVIMPPEIVIGALGRIRKLPRFNSSGLVEERHIMQIVWSADHRVVDGATLSRFSNLIKRYLEETDLALLTMI